MTIASVITVGYGQGVNYIPTLGYRDAASPPEPIIIHNNEGAGAGRKRNQAYKLEVYEELGRAAAEEREKKLLTINHKFTETLYQPAKKPREITPRLRQQKIGDVNEIRRELQKLQFDITKEISLQSEEDEAIFMLMLMAT